MKKLIILSSIFFTLSALALSKGESQSFSAYKIVGPETVLLSAFVSGRDSSYSKISLYNLASQKGELTMLPTEFKNRKIIAIAGTENKSQFVLVTQWNHGDADDPQFHLWNKSANTWEELGTLKCPVVDEINVQKQEIQLVCLSLDNIDKKGNRIKEKKSFSYRSLASAPADGVISSIETKGLLNESLEIQFNKKLARKPLLLTVDQIFGE